MDASPKVVIFDVNETLTDMTPLRARFEDAGLPGELLPVWFASVLRDGIALAAAGGFAEFGQIAADVLRELLAGRADVSARRAGVPGDTAGNGPDAPRGHPERVVAHVLDGFSELRVHADIPDGMRMLRGAGIRLFTMTNGSAPITERVLAREGLLDLVEARMDVTGPRVWKPAPAAYLYAVERTGVRPEEAALVAVHPWDVDGAQRAGLIGAWLNRRAMPYPTAMTTPDVIASDLRSLAALWAER